MSGRKAYGFRLVFRGNPSTCVVSANDWLCPLFGLATLSLRESSWSNVHPRSHLISGRVVWLCVSTVPLIEFLPNHVVAPNLVEIPVGGQVDFFNNDLGTPHYIDFSDPALSDPEELSPGQTIRVQFPSQGDWAFQCLYHTSALTEHGTIRVTQP